MGNHLSSSLPQCYTVIQRVDTTHLNLVHAHDGSGRPVSAQTVTQTLIQTHTPELTVVSCPPAEGDKTDFGPRLKVNSWWMCVALVMLDERRFLRGSVSARLLPVVSPVHCLDHVLFYQAGVLLTDPLASRAACTRKRDARTWLSYTFRCSLITGP